MADNAHSADSTGTSAPVRAPAREAGKRLLLLGLGNDLLRDDAIGLKVVREARLRVADLKEVEVLETTEMGLSLLDYLVGYEAVLIVDAVKTGTLEAGRAHEVEVRDLAVVPAISPHFVGVGEVLLLGEKLGLVMPSSVRIMAIEVEDPHTLSTDLTPKLQEALPGLVDRAVSLVRGL